MAHNGAGLVGDCVWVCLTDDAAHRSDADKRKAERAAALAATAAKPADPTLAAVAAVAAKERVVK
jgi:hypothetical protein